MDFLEPAVAHKFHVCVLAPVIEVTGNHKRRITRYSASHQFEQGANLPLPVRSAQRKVDAYRVQAVRSLWHVQNAIEHPARFRAANRDIDILPGHDRIL